MFVVGAHPHHRLPGAGLRPQVLRLPLDVVLDQRVGDRQDVLRRSVVLLHQEDGGVRVVPLEIQDVLDRGASPGVDALVGIADDTDVAVLLREHVHELVLRSVRVLVLVDQDVPEPLLVVLEHLRVIAEEPDGFADQVVEVQGAGIALPALVLRIEPSDGLLVQVGGEVGELRRAEHAVLRLPDRGRDRLRRVALRVDVHVARDAGDQPFRVAVVVDREVRRNPQVGVLLPEDPGAGGVEREDPHTPRDRAAQEVSDPLRHLPRGLVGERDREDLPRGDPALPDQVGDPMRERPLVLPDPAPATIRTGPSVWRTACRWMSLRPSRRGEVTLTRRC